MKNSHESFKTRVFGVLGVSEVARADRRTFDRYAKSTGHAVGFPWRLRLVLHKWGHVFPENTCQD